MTLYEYARWIQARFYAPASLLNLAAKSTLGRNEFQGRINKSGTINSLGTPAEAKMICDKMWGPVSQQFLPLINGVNLGKEKNRGSCLGFAYLIAQPIQLNLGEIGADWLCYLACNPINVFFPFLFLCWHHLLEVKITWPGGICTPHYSNGAPAMFTS
jgi:hypothetical protein